MSNSAPASSGTTSPKATITTREAFKESSTTVSIFIEPPYFDDKYARISAKTHSELPHAKSTVETHDEARTYLDKILTDLKTNSDKPTPSLDNTHLYVYPHYEDEFTLPELFGNQSLGAFTNSNTSTETPIEAAGNWYALTDAYDTWVKPVLDPDSDSVLTYTRAKHGRWQTYWLRGTRSNPEWIHYDHGTHSWSGPTTAELTKVVRAIGAHGLIYPTLESLDRQLTPETHVPNGKQTAGTIGTEIIREAETPFADKYSHPYLEATGHRQTVNGWTFDPDALGRDGWTNPDETITVQVRYDDVRIIHNNLTQDLSADYIVTPDTPALETDDSPTRAELRTIATEWMETHPADSWKHPLGRYVDATLAHDTFNHPALNTRLQERNGELHARITPDDDSPFAPDRDFYAYSFEVVGDVSPNRSIPPESTTGFTATHIVGTSPGAGNFTRDHLTTGSLLDALDTVADTLSSGTNCTK